jgi:hypothetical protein
LVLRPQEKSSLSRHLRAIDRDRTQGMKFSGNFRMYPSIDYRYFEKFEEEAVKIASSQTSADVKCGLFGDTSIIIKSRWAIRD